MIQFGGKPKKTSSDSKRHFTVVIGKKEHGLYISLIPSSAAKKAVTKLCASNKSKKVEFYMREITLGSKKKTYGPYEGYIEKLKEPIELKGRVIKYKPVAKLRKKSGGGEGNLKNRVPYTALMPTNVNDLYPLPPQSLSTPHISRNKLNKSIFLNKNRLKKFITKHYPNEIDDFFDYLYESNGFQADLNFLNKNKNSREIKKKELKSLLNMYMNPFLELQSKTNDFFISHPELFENEKKFVRDYIKIPFSKLSSGIYDKVPWTKNTSKKTALDNKNYQIDEARKKELEQLVLKEIYHKFDTRKNHLKKSVNYSTS